MFLWKVVVVVTLDALLFSSLVRTAVIEKANVLESPREYYERIKNIPVDHITQEVEDTYDNVQQMLLNNPLLRQLAMFSNNSTQERNSKQTSQKVKDRNIIPLSLKRPKYKPTDDNFDGDYARFNKTMFENVDSKVEHEIRRLPSGRKLGPDRAVPSDATYGNENDEPFAVTDSLVRSLEKANEAVVPIRFDQDGANEHDRDYHKNQINAEKASEFHSTSSASHMATTQTLSEIAAAVPTLNLTENSPGWTQNYGTTLTHDVLPTTAPALKTKAKYHDLPGLKESKFQGTFYVPEEIHDTPARRQMSDEIAQMPVMVRKPEWTHGFPYKIGNRAAFSDNFGDIVAVKRIQGGFVVSGTSYYFDNRVDGDVRSELSSDVMKEEYNVRDDSKELAEMMRDPRFAVEMELSRLKKQMNRKYTQEGTKLYKMREAKMPNEPDPESTVSMMQLGGRLFEQRVTEIGGKKVTVQLANKHLHGVDLIVRPGSVVNGQLPSGEEKAVVEKSKISKRAFIPLAIVSSRSENTENSLETPVESYSVQLEPVQPEGAIELSSNSLLDGQKSNWKAEIETDIVDMCFFVKTDAQLVGLNPIEKYVGERRIDCIIACAKNKRCRSINYSESISKCEIFDQLDSSATTIQHQLGYTYYIPKQTDVQGCINDVIHIAKQFSSSGNSQPIVNCGANDSCKTLASFDVLEPSTFPLHSYRLLPSKAKCSSDSAVLFIRSDGYRNEKGRNLDTVSRISEDDCLFSCLTNKVVDSHPVLCASAEYDKKDGRCTLSSEPRMNALSENPSVTFYEKICVTRSVSDQCSGATVDRSANMVVVGFMRHTITTASIEQCIERCVQSEIAFGFQCLSIMYYYDETVLNCILNDASARTNPESMAEELSSIVDYFGIDDCYGLPEAMDSRQNFLRGFPLSVEDITGTERTPRMQLNALRRTNRQTTSTSPSIQR